MAVAWQRNIMYVVAGVMSSIMAYGVAAATRYYRQHMHDGVSLAAYCVAEQ